MRRDELYRLPGGRESLKAHDVRQLAACAICGGLADKRTSISYLAAYGYHAKDKGACWHPRCCFDHFGAEFVLSLPVAEQNKFCLSDVDVPTMRRMLNDRDAAITRL